MKSHKANIKGGIILSYVNIFMSIIVAMIFTPFLLNRIGQSEFGLYSLAYSAIMLFSVFDLGLGNTNIRYIAKYREEGNSHQESVLHGTSLILYSCIGVIILTVGLIFSSMIPSIFRETITHEDLSKLKLMMQFITVSLAISFPLSVFRYVLMGYERFLFIKISDLLRTILIPIISIILLLFQLKSVALIIGISTIYVAINLINFCYALLYLDIKFSFKINQQFIKEIFYYSFWVFLGTLTYQLNNNTNQFILGVVAGTIPVAIYALGYNLIINFQNVSFSLSSLFLPSITRFAQKENRNEKYNEYFIKIGRLQYYVMSLFVLGFICFGKQFINLWVGNEYYDSYYVSLIILFPLSMFLVQTIGITILQAENKHKFSSILFMIMVCLNIVSSFILSKYFAAIGAAISIGSALLTGHVIILNIFYYKKIKIDVLEFWKQILGISKYFIFPGAFASLYLYFYNADSWVNLAIGIFFFTLTYLVSIIFSFNTFEKNLIIRPLVEKFKKYGIG